MLLKLRLRGRGGYLYPPNPPKRLPPYRASQNHQNSASPHVARYGGSLSGGCGGNRFPPRSRFRTLSNILPDKSKFESGRFVNHPCRNRAPTTCSSPKDKGGKKQKDTSPSGLCLRQIPGTPPNMGATMFAPPPLGGKKIFLMKSFCGAFFKKRPPAPQRPRARRRPRYNN